VVLLVVLQLLAPRRLEALLSPQGRELVRNTPPLEQERCIPLQLGLVLCTRLPELGHMPLWLA